MRLLICLDRTDFARSILPVAKRFAEAMAAEVELLTVVAPEPRGGEPWSGQQPPQVSQKMIDDSKNALASAAGGFSPAARVTVVDGASAADAIVRHARATRPDLIALATHSRGALGEAALGSTAREVTRAGVAPVLLLHPSATVGMRSGDVPIGIYAFTADGEIVGEVAEVMSDRMRLRQDGGRELWLPCSAAGAITTGRLVLEVAAADIPALSLQV